MDDDKSNNQNQNDQMPTSSTEQPQHVGPEHAEIKASKSSFVKNKKVFIGIALALVIIGVSTFFNRNPAKSDAKPLVKYILSIGGREICSEGNNAKGFLNAASGPWFTGYYYMPQRKNIANELKERLRKQSIDIISTQDFKAKLGADGHGFQLRPTDSENKKLNEYYIYKSDKEYVEVNLINDGAPFLRCAYGTRSYEPKAGDGYTVIELYWTKWGK